MVSRGSEVISSPGIISAMSAMFKNSAITFFFAFGICWPEYVTLIKPLSVTCRCTLVEMGLISIPVSPWGVTSQRSSVSARFCSITSRNVAASFIVVDEWTLLFSEMSLLSLLETRIFCPPSQKTQKISFVIFLISHRKQNFFLSIT